MPVRRNDFPAGMGALSTFPPPRLDFWSIDDGLIVRRAIRGAAAGDRGLATNRYPLGQANPGNPDECSSG